MNPARNDDGNQLHHIVLLGPMAAGKTTIGRALAEVLGIPLLDSDAEIVARTGRSGRQIAATDGVATLHELERDVLVTALANAQQAVIAPAASVVDDAELVAALRQHCCVWLRADAAVLAERRSDADHRRGMASSEVTRLAQRDAIYAELADLIIDTDRRTIRASVRAVLAQCGVGAGHELG